MAALMDAAVASAVLLAAAVAAEKLVAKAGEFAAGLSLAVPHAIAAAWHRTAMIAAGLAAETVAEAAGVAALAVLVVVAVLAQAEA